MSEKLETERLILYTSDITFVENILKYYTEN